MGAFLSAANLLQRSFVEAPGGGTVQVASQGSIKVGAQVGQFSGGNRQDGGSVQTLAQRAKFGAVRVKVQHDHPRPRGVQFMKGVWRQHRSAERRMQGLAHPNLEGLSSGDQDRNGVVAVRFRFDTRGGVEQTAIEEIEAVGAERSHRLESSRGGREESKLFERRRLETVASGVGRPQEITMSRKVIETLQQLSTRQLAQNEVVFREGDLPNDEMYFVLQGEVSIRKQRPDGEHEINRLVQGNFFGEMALVNTRSRLATAVCLSPVVKLVVINRDNMLRLAGTSPPFLFNLLKYAVSRLLAAEDKLQRVKEERDAMKGGGL